MDINEKNIKETCIYENENQMLDFKREYKPGKGKTPDILRDIISFANCHTRGTKNIIIGVEEKAKKIDEKIVGIDIVPEVSEFENVIHDNVEPEISISLEKYDIDNKTIAVLKINDDNYNNRPFLMKKKFENLKEGEGFIRKGASNRPLKRNDYIEIFQKKEENNKLEILEYDYQVINHREQIQELEIEREDLCKRINEFIELSKKEKVEIEQLDVTKHISLGIENYQISKERYDRIKNKINTNIEKILSISNLKARYSINSFPYFRKLEEVFSFSKNSQEAYLCFLELEKIIKKIDLYNYFNEYGKKLLYIEAPINVKNIEIRIKGFRPNTDYGTAINDIISIIENNIILPESNQEIKKFREEIDLAKEQRRNNIPWTPPIFEQHTNYSKDIEDIYNLYAPYDNVEYNEQKEEVVIRLSYMSKEEKIFFPFYILSRKNLEYQISSSQGKQLGKIIFDISTNQA